jgi:hypothetical protein
VHTAPNGISYRTRRFIRHQMGFLTAQDGAYDTKRDSLHCFHSGSLLTSRKPSQLHRVSPCQFISSSTHCSLLSYHRTTFIVASSGIFFVLISSQVTIIPVERGITVQTTANQAWPLLFQSISSVRSKQTQKSVL